MTFLRQLKQTKAIIKKIALHCFTFSQPLLNRTSINQLTFIGFTLVAVPLVLSLLFSANKVSKLASQSTNDIYHVAQLTQLNSKLDDAVAKIERSASQYIVLKDGELLSLFSRHQKAFKTLLLETMKREQDEELKELLMSLKIENERINTIVFSDNVDNVSLGQIQQEFKVLHYIEEELKIRSNTVVNQQVLAIHQTTENISNNILQYLYIIPVTLLIAGIFIIFISRPLNQLTDKIKILEQGNFEKEIELHGPAEVREIVHALENMRQRLHALELQKSSFIRHISHELKTPLAAVREGTELIYDNSVGPLNDDQQEICNIIRTSANRLQRLIEDLLDFNIVLDSTSLKGLEKVNLPELINETCEVRKLDIKSKNLRIQYDNSACTLYSNHKQLGVILDNILSNAIKYSPNDGVIDINYASSDAGISIKIIDQGPGIAPSISEKVFDAFYQGTPPENSLIKGSGLGLTIVKELLLRLDGSISIVPAEQVSTANKTGTSVTITLPNKKNN